ncbi:MAG: hypothetical protein K6F56_00395 [Oscillospiraceae bacterium]|nr:hypothetical protein [Oscillospiraceae bacterium]
MEEKMFNVVGLRMTLPMGLFKNAYLYADSRDYQSLRVFRRKGGLRGFRVCKSYVFKLDPKYCLVGCTLNKREERAFLEALDELQRDLLVMGYRDYEQYCDDVFTMVKQAI